MNRIPRLAVTPGEPSGIGPDLIIQLSQTLQNAELIVIADKALMLERAKQLGLSLSIKEYDAQQEASLNKVGEITLLNIPCAVAVNAGVLNLKNSNYVLETLTRATEGCLSGEFDAIVTAPLHKGIINDAGIPFTGHTEFLAKLTGAKLPVMMLAAGTLRVALATTHLPLKDVSQAITKESLRQVITILHQDLINKLGLESPRILVCGLNPHAGESGHMGMEEIETIQPVIDELKKTGMNLSEPLPADTLFTPKYLESADAVLAMYHDQGLPVLKHVGFGHAVNITLGLPIIRTSVDHGTALDLAGSGKAKTGSLIAAIESAVKMVSSQSKNTK